METMFIEIRNLQTTKMQSISCAPDSGVRLCTFIRVRYDVSFKRSLRPETGNALVEI